MKGEEDEDEANRDAAQVFDAAAGRRAEGDEGNDASLCKSAVV